MAQITIKATSGFVANGKIITPGAEVSVAAELARDLIGRGKAIAVTAAAVTLEDGEEIAPLEECTDEELREIAKEYKIKGATKLPRESLLEAIRAHEAVASEASLEGGAE